MESGYKNDILCSQLVQVPRYLSGKDSTCNARDLDSIPSSGRFPWRRKWQPTPVFLPEEFMDRVAWRAIVHGVAKCRTQLCTHIQSKFIKQNYLIALKDIQMCYKHMCTHASISAQPHVWIYLSPFIYIHTHIF